MCGELGHGLRGVPITPHPPFLPLLLPFAYAQPFHSSILYPFLPNIGKTIDGWIPGNVEGASSEWSETNELSGVKGMNGGVAGTRVVGPSMRWGGCVCSCLTPTAPLTPLTLVPNPSLHSLATLISFRSVLSTPFFYPQLRFLPDKSSIISCV